MKEPAGIMVNMACVLLKKSLKLGRIVDHNAILKSGSSHWLTPSNAFLFILLILGLPCFMKTVCDLGLDVIPHKGKLYCN